jgi:hypothetical protein
VRGYIIKQGNEKESQQFLCQQTSARRNFFYGKRFSQHFKNSRRANEKKRF